MPIEPKSVASSWKRARLAEQKGLTSSGVRHPATFKYHSPPNGSASETFFARHFKDSPHSPDLFG